MLKCEYNDTLITVYDNSNLLVQAFLSNINGSLYITKVIGDETSRYSKKSVALYLLSCLVDQTQREVNFQVSDSDNFFQWVSWNRPWSISIFHFALIDTKLIYPWTRAANIVTVQASSALKDYHKITTLQTAPELVVT